MSYVRNGPFFIKLSFDPLLKPRLCGVRKELACRTCLDWYKLKVYFLVPNGLSKIDDLVELVRAQHGIRSEISFVAAEFGVLRSLPIEILKEIQEPIEVVAIGPGVPKVDFPKCNCAAATDSNQVANMIRNLNESMGGEDDESKIPGVHPGPVARQNCTIQHPGNLVRLEGETSQAAIELRNSNASYRPADVTVASEFTESNGIQEEDESDWIDITSGSKMALSVQESINSKGYYDSAEAGESIGCEDKGSAMDVSCKETEDGDEQCYSVSVNETVSDQEHCAGDEQSNYSDLGTANVSSNVGGEDNESKLNGVRQRCTIQHPGNLVPSEEETSKADVELRNSNASYRPADVTVASEITESNGIQEEDQSDWIDITSGSKMVLSVQESINSKGYYDSSEAGESIGCEDKGSAMDVSCKETEDGDEQCYSVSVNETASDQEHCAGDEQSNYSDLGRATISLNVEESMDSQEGDDDKEMDVNEVGREEDSSLEISVEASRKNDSTNIFEGTSEWEGVDVTAEETGISEEKTKSDSIISGCDSLDKCLNTPKTLAEKLMEPEQNLNLDEHDPSFTSTPRPPINTVRTSKGTPYPQKFFDTSIASEDQGGETAAGQISFQEEGQESCEKFFTSSSFS